MRVSRKGCRAVLGVVAVVLLLGIAVQFAGSGCATMPVPRSPAQSLVMAEAEYTAVLRTATDMTRAGALSRSQVEDLDRAFAKANAILDTTWDAWFAASGQLDQAGGDKVLAGVDALREVLIVIRAQLGKGGDR